MHLLGLSSISLHGEKLVILIYYLILRGSLYPIRVEALLHTHTHTHTLSLSLSLSLSILISSSISIAEGVLHGPQAKALHARQP